MMSDASIADCLAKQWDPSLISYVFIIIDLTLTSSIASSLAVMYPIPLNTLETILPDYFYQYLLL